jgi:hypothetical protein
MVRCACQRGEGKLTLGGEEGDGRAFLASSPGSPDAVDIVFRVVGVVIVEDMSDIADIFKDRLAISQSVILRGVGDHVWSCERRCMTLSETRSIILWMMANVHVRGIGNRLRSLENRSWICSLLRSRKFVPPSTPGRRSRDGSQEAESWQTAKRDPGFPGEGPKRTQSLDKLRSFVA